MKSHEQKVNYIKYWLQKFGNRDNETFNIEVVIDETIWDISLQYNFDEDGDQIEPYDWCRRSFKQLVNNQISDRTDEELDRIIEILRFKQEFY